MSEPLPSGACAAIDLWPDGPPAGFVTDRTERLMPNPDPAVPERWVVNVARPTLTHFPATMVRRGLSMLVVPGGAFHFVSIDNEGYDVARALAAIGIDAFVLKYRVHPLPETDADTRDYLDRLWVRLGRPAPGQSDPPTRESADMLLGRALAVEDGRQAMRLLRAGAGAWGIDPARLGVVGFSAGGGVAADLALAAPPDCRPAFAAPIYAAWQPAPVPSDCPPMFLATAADDPVVAPFASAELARICHGAGVPVALHVYGNGGHGFGIRKQGCLSDRWFDDLSDWLRRVVPHNVGS